MFAPHPFRDDEIGLKAHIVLIDLVDAIAAGARRCLDDFGLTGFAEQWVDAPFLACS